MRTRLRLLLATLASFGLIAACGNGAVSGGGTGPRGGRGSAGGDAGTDARSGEGSLGISCSAASPTFSGDVHPILQACGGERCHGGLAIGAWPYDQLVGAPASRDHCDPSAVIVKPGDLDGSYLMHKLTGVGMCPHTSQMPSLGAPLPAADIQTIADWICRGAPND